MMSKNCKIIHLSEVASTNDFAKKLLKERRPEEGTAIVADYQIRGKGQDKNTWESEAGKNILMSMILYPHFLAIQKQFSISMCVALGIADLLQDILTEQEIYIKWPNDIFVGNAKLGGILINNEVMGDRFEHVIAGIGINVNQERFSEDIPHPVSLYNLSGKYYSLQEMTVKLCECVSVRYEQLRSGLSDQIEAEYLGFLLGLNEVREYIYAGERISAAIKGVNEFGHLMLETDGRKIECDLKEISYVFP